MKEEEYIREKGRWGRWARARACHALSVRSTVSLGPTDVTKLRKILSI